MAKWHRSVLPWLAWAPCLAWVTEADAATIPPEVVAVAQARGRARDLQATVRELLEELDH